MESRVTMMAIHPPRKLPRLYQKAQGKQRAVSSDLDDELESPNDWLTSPPTSPAVSATSAAELPPAEYVPPFVAGIVEPWAEASEGSGLDCDLVANTSLTMTEPSRVQSVLYPDISGPSTSRRSKRIRTERHTSTQLGDGACSEDSCGNPTDAQLMVKCAGPGCGLMVSGFCSLVEYAD
jgi:hypothetical protein